MRRRVGPALILLAAGLLIGGCRSRSLPQMVSCPADKIAFTRESGCVNDGSVEFCIPRDDPGVLAAAHQIAPVVTVLKESRGRAGCGPDQVLVLLPTGGLCDPTDPGAMSRAGWAKVCALARLPGVPRVVPTWYE